MNNVRLPKSFFNSITDWTLFNYTTGYKFENNTFVDLMDLNPTFIDTQMDGKVQKTITSIDYLPNFIRMPKNADIYYSFAIDFNKKVVIDWNGSKIWSPFHSTTTECSGIAPLSINMDTEYVYNLFSRAKFSSYWYNDFTNCYSNYAWFGTASKSVDQTSDYYFNCYNARFENSRIEEISVIIISKGYQIRPFNINKSIELTMEMTLDNLRWIIKNGLLEVTSTKTLTIGSTNLAKLTDEDKKIATDKGWTLA